MLIWGLENLKYSDSAIIQYIMSHLLIFIIIFILIFLTIYIVIAVFLNKLNNEMYNKTTWMAWVPFFDIFLLGKLTIHWIFGIVLVILNIIGIGYYIEIPEVQKLYSSIPKNIIEPGLIIYLSLVFMLYIYAHIKLSNLKRKKDAQSDFSKEEKTVSEYDLKYSKINDNKAEDYSNQDNESMVKLQDLNRMNSHINSEQIKNDNMVSFDEIKELDDKQNP